MVYEYAVEPAALNNWQDFRYVYDQIGVEHGRLISRYPSKWASMVMKSCEENKHLRDVDRLRIVEKLKNQEKNKMARLNRSYDSDNDSQNTWMSNVAMQNRQRPFHAIIARSIALKIPNLINIENVDPSHPLWQVPKDNKVLRKAKELAQCSRLLLQMSKEILIIDPHFDPMERRFLKTFSHLIKYAFEEHAPKRIELHVEYDYWKEQKRATDWGKDCLQNLPLLIPEGFTLQVFRWKSRARGEGNNDKLHPRYVMTELGGIRYDYGIDEGPGTTDVTLLSVSLYEQRWHDYQKETSAFELFGEPILIQGSLRQNVGERQT
jgi:hypothetical protein